MADEETESEGEEGEGKKGPSKLIIIIIAIVVLLLLGGGAAFFFMGGEAPVEEQAQATGGEKAAPKIVDVDEKGNPLPPLFYEMKPAFLAHFPPEGKHRLLQISITVLTRQQLMADFLKENDPMIRHNLLNLLSGCDAEALKTRSGKDKLVQDVMAKIQELADAASVEGRVQGVYFTKLVME